MRSTAIVTAYANDNSNGDSRLERLPRISARDSKLVQALIDAAGSNIVVLDEHLTIVFSNRGWRHFAARMGSARGDHGIGQKYPDLFAGIASASLCDTRAVRNGLDRLLTNEELEFQMKYRCTALARPMWFIMRAASFNYPGIRERRLIVVSHEQHSDAESSYELRSDGQGLHRLLQVSNIFPWQADERNSHNHFSYEGEQGNDLLGYTADEWKAEGFWAGRLHPADRSRVIDDYSRLYQTTDHFKCEYRMIARDDRVVWVQDIVSVERSETGPPTIHGLMIDITDRKEAESALADLGGRLITAQEEERKRIARELHDDLNQRIALISIELEQVAQRSDNGSGREPMRVNQIKRKLSEISTAIHRMSYELHPSKLEHVGLGPTLKSFCTELARKRGVKIDLEQEFIPNGLHRDVTLCVFRVAQEALQNAAKHSGADKIKVRLAASDTSIELDVTDNGNGFLTSAKRMTKGLGITSMQERARLARGEFRVVSEPGRGTWVGLKVPLSLTVESNFRNLTHGQSIYQSI